MKFSLFLAVLAATPVLAQQPSSTEVQSDGSVIFRLRAPKAASVQVHAEGVSATEMTRDDRGVWSLTTPPLPPDIYTYSFTVDGMRALDLGNPLLKYNLLSSDSQVHVPGPSTLAWEINDVPRGVVHHHPYHSLIAGDDRQFIVYTPPGYDASSRKKYPVLYLVHGFSDDTDGWLVAGFANVILDNLIARHQARPMIVVLPSGYGTTEILKGAGLRNAAMARKNFEMFRDTLLQEVVPRTEKAYHVASDAKDRAIAGLSMGGAESLFVGLNAPDKFAWVGAFSSGGMNTNFAANYPLVNPKMRRELRLLWMGCGSEDRLVTINRNLSQWITTNGVPHTWVEMPGGHSFRVWRPFLAEFVPRLFQAKK